MSFDPTTEHPTKISVNEARQAQRTFGLRILLISSALVVAAIAVIYLFSEFADRDPAPPAATDAGEITLLPSDPIAENTDDAIAPAENAAGS